MNLKIKAESFKQFLLSSTRDVCTAHHKWFLSLMNNSNIRDTAKLLHTSGDSLSNLIWRRTYYRAQENLDVGATMLKLNGCTNTIIWKSRIDSTLVLSDRNLRVLALDFTVSSFNRTKALKILRIPIFFLFLLICQLTLLFDIWWA